MLDTSPPDPQGTRVGPDGGVYCDRAADCDDGNVCTGEETCVGHTCVPGTPVVCPSEGCLVGYCKPDGSCGRSPSADACSDGIGCTVDQCSDAGVCSNVLDHEVCDDGLSCTRDVCVGVAIGAANSGCYSLPDDSLCEQPIVANACASYACAPTMRADGDVTGCVPRLHDICGERGRCNLETFQCELFPTGCDGCNDGVDCNGIEVCDPVEGFCAQQTPACVDTNDDCFSEVCNLRSDNVACGTVKRLDTQCIGVPTPNP